MYKLCSAFNFKVKHYCKRALMFFFHLFNEKDIAISRDVNICLPSNNIDRKTKREAREWHPDFYDYMNTILENDAYKGLSIEYKKNGSPTWLAPAESKVGKERKLWAEGKAKDFNWDIKPGVYADILREIHPTKIHTCQLCGSKMSIYYIYPTKHFIDELQNKFHFSFSQLDSLETIWDKLLSNGLEEKELIEFMINSFGLSESVYPTKDAVIKACEHSCRKKGKKKLSPGVMSNFPDRFDGFHSYNICCRKKSDKGRSDENMKSYTKDRRAYEYWSDGNIRATNLLMGDVSYFSNDVSADHIGPISLGFVHDHRYLQQMTTRENSAKRDKLSKTTIDRIIEIETKTNISPISWFAKIIWDYIKQNYKNNSDETIAYDILKQNMVNFMFVMKYILSCKNGELFLSEKIIEPRYYNGFDYDYKFELDSDRIFQIVKKTKRNMTARSNGELVRFKEIAFDSVKEFHDEKENSSRVACDITESEKKQLENICNRISTEENSFNEAYVLLIKFIENMQTLRIS